MKNRRIGDMATILAVIACSILGSALWASRTCGTEIRFPSVEDPSIAVGTVMRIEPRFYRDRYGNKKTMGQAVMEVDQTVRGIASDQFTFLVWNIAWIDPVSRVEQFSSYPSVPWVYQGDKIVGVFAPGEKPRGSTDTDSLFNLPQLRFVRWFESARDTVDYATPVLNRVPSGQSGGFLDTGLSLAETIEKLLTRYPKSGE